MIVFLKKEDVVVPCSTKPQSMLWWGVLLITVLCLTIREDGVLMDGDQLLE